MRKLAVAAGFLLIAVTALGAPTEGSAPPVPGDKGSGGLPPGRKARRYALVIGINDYKHYGKLKYCRQDAEEMAGVLVERAGFDPKRLCLVTDGEQPKGFIWSEATFADLYDRIEQFTGLPKEGDTLLIFFTGHGVTIGDEAYLMPANGRNERTAISMSWLRQRMAKCKATSKVLILDACHSGEATYGVLGISPGAAQGAATLVLASCAAEEVSYPDDEAGRGVFTAGLLEGLSGLADADKDANITGDELFQYARDHVEEWCILKDKTQMPQMSPKEAGGLVIATVPDEVRIAAEREGRYREAMAEGEKLLKARLWTQAQAAFRRALAVPGYGADAAARAGLKTARGGAEAYRKRQAYQAAHQKLQAAHSKARGTEDKKLWQAVLDLSERAMATGHTDVSAAKALLKEAQKHLGPALPRGWTFEKRRVKVATPKGVEWKEITYYKNTIGMEFALIPAGEFMMGSRDSAAEVAREAGTKEEYYTDEHPRHRVRVTKPFYMGAHEVTQAEYERLMGKNPARFKGTRNPVEKVSWNDAVEFCRRLSQKESVTYRLPTEAEGEYACRAGTTTPFYTGETISTELANYDGDYTYARGKKGVYREKTTSVGSFPANSWGLHDMHGSVWEWCQSLYKQYPYRADDGRENLRATGDRVLRGGSWGSNPDCCRSAPRSRGSPSNSYDNYGFRVVLLAE